MGARYLKTEDEAIARYYPTATRAEIIKLIPNRTWSQIEVKASRMGIHRTSKAWGNSVREGRKLHKDAWTDQQNELFDALYPEQTHAQLFAAFPNRTLSSLQAHAQKRYLHRAREAAGKQMNIGRENAKENDS